MKIVRARGKMAGDQWLDALCLDVEDQLDQLPLERFCERGGWPLQPELSRISMKEAGATGFTVVLHVFFIETGAACCSGDNFEHQRYVELLMEINAQNGACTFPN